MAEMTIRRFSVFSVAQVQALLGFVIGLIIGDLRCLHAGAAMLSLAPNEEQAMGGGVGAIVAGVVVMIVVPVFYGILGFIGGVIGALVYNVAAGVVGGIRFELEGVTPAYAPPPPQQWNPSNA